MDVKTILALAQNAVDLNNIQAACEFYEVGLQQHPNDVDVLEAYGEIMLHFVQDLSRSKQLLEHAISVCPDNGHVKYLNLAQISTGHEALGLYEKAIMLLLTSLRSLRKKSQQRSVRRSLSEVYCAMAELFLTDLCEESDAETRCESLLQTAENYCDRCVDVFQLQGSLKLNQLDYEGALKKLRHAVYLTHQLNESHQPTYESKIELGRLLMQASPLESLSFFVDILDLDDENPYVWFLIGECARLCQKFHDAARFFRRARVLSILRDGDQAASLGEIDNAIQILIKDMAECNQSLDSVQDLDCDNPIALLFENFTDSLLVDEDPDKILMNEDMDQQISDSDLELSHSDESEIL